MILIQDMVDNPEHIKEFGSRNAEIEDRFKVSDSKIVWCGHGSGW